MVTVCAYVSLLGEWSKQCALVCVSACLDVLMCCILHISVVDFV